MLRKSGNVLLIETKSLEDPSLRDGQCAFPDIRRCSLGAQMMRVYTFKCVK